MNKVTQDILIGNAIPLVSINWLLGKHNGINAMVDAKVSSDTENSSTLYTSLITADMVEYPYENMPAAI